MSEEEVALRGGRMTEGIVRVGDTVRKPSSENAEFVHRLLIHMEEVGFHGAPRFLGVDEKGRDIFTFIEGFTYVEWFDEVLSDAKLAAIGGLLRAFHDATDGTPLVTGQEVVVHNDAGPFNMVWVDERPVALIDFGAAKPGDRLEDLGYALWKGLLLEWGPMKEREAEPVFEGRRAKMLLDAYGLDDRSEIVDAMLGQQERMRRMSLADPDTPSWWLEDCDKETAWLHSNRDAFTRALM